MSRSTVFDQQAALWLDHQDFVHWPTSDLLGTCLMGAMWDDLN
jgi:hypothetical protein